MHKLLRNNTQRQQKLARLFKKYKVAFAYLFGSRAGVEAGPLSDLDIAVYFDETIRPKDYFDLKLKLLGALTDIFKRDDIDLVALNQAPFVLENRIITQGSLLYSEDEKKRTAYEDKALINYFDWRFFEEKFSRAILERRG